jgi:polar amino acid transport system substrate-binding protein
MSDFSRRQVLKDGAVLALLTAACATSGTASGAPAGETTLQRIKRTKTVRVGFTNEPPFSVAAPDKTTGIDPDIMTAFLKTQGVTEVDGVLMEFGSLIPALLANRIDTITAGLYMSVARCGQIAFSDPTTQIGEAFAVKKGNPLKLNSYKDVVTANAKFAANTGGLEFGWADVAGIPKDNQIKFADLQTSVAALQAGRVDCVVNNTLAIADYLKKLNDPNIEYAQLTEQPVDASGKSALAYSSFGFRQEDTDFVTAFNTWIAQVKANGQLLAIGAPYGVTQDAIPPADRTAAKICAGN